jgi:Tfp pilus assembly pilus retraction ATPase PilT
VQVVSFRLRLYFRPQPENAPTPMQRGTCAIVIRVIPDKIPSFADLRLPPTLQQIVELRNDIVLVT